MPDSHRASAQAAAAESAEAAAAPNSQPQTAKNGQKRQFHWHQKNHCDANGMKFVASTKFFSILRKVFVSEYCHKCIKKTTTAVDDYETLSGLLQIG